jgi:type VI secretion system protein ImpA
MALSAVVDLNVLLAPISGDNPAGESVRYAGVYDAIQEARREDDALPMGEWQREAKTADWRAVINLCSETIGKKSKDLQIGAWLVEALVRRHGFAGLREGLSILRELQRNFWDGLYPEVEDGDLEFRAGPLNWLNEKLPIYVRAVALTEGDPALTWNHWDESRNVDNLGRRNPDAMQAAIAEGKVTGEQFNKSVAGTQRAFYENLFEDLTQTKEELSQLEKVVDEKFGPNAPSLIKARSAVDECHQLVAGIVKQKREQDPNYKKDSENIANAKNGDAGLDNSHGGSNATTTSGTVGWFGEPNSREEAFQRLVVIANYLKRVEPQHPVSYLLERAVRWTKMPLEDWLNEVVRNDDVLKHLHDTLGIKAKEST